MPRLWTVLTWVFGGLAFDLALLSVLAAPQQACADNDPCVICDLQPDPQACRLRCEAAFAAGCDICAFYSDPQAYAQCMTSCAAGQTYCGGGTSTCLLIPNEECTPSPNIQCNANVNCACRVKPLMDGSRRCVCQNITGN